MPLRRGQNPLSRLTRVFFAILLPVALYTPGSAATQSATPVVSDSGFAEWLGAFKREARAKGISQTTIDTALAGVEPIPRIIELDRRQAEFTQTFWSYIDRRVTEQRLTRGKEVLARYSSVLAEIERRYGVQRRFLIAFWGLESNYGQYTGDFSVVGALATLAYDPRRSELFREQLLGALRIIDQGHISADRMKGSWAGAMGHVQFLPTTFARYAVDFDGDRRKDIWTSVPDALASAANYLAALGWQGDRTWGREVRLPPGFPLDQADLNIRKPLAAWSSLGVTRIDGGVLPQVDINGAIVLPGGHRGPAFLVYDNFHSTLRWNRSILYAISVGHLADRLAGQSSLRTARPAQEVPLSRDQVEELQKLLVALGFAAGQPDGVVGARTRAALKAFQKQAQKPADGYPTIEILQHLRAAQGG